MIEKNECIYVLAHFCFSLRPTAANISLGFINLLSY